MEYSVLSRLPTAALLIEGQGENPSQDEGLMKGSVLGSLPTAALLSTDNENRKVIVTDNARDRKPLLGRMIRPWRFLNEGVMQSSAADVLGRAFFGEGCAAFGVVF